MKRLSWLLLIWGTLALGFWGRLSVQAQGEPPPGGERYFEQTGHYLSGPFLARYEATPDAEILFGYPITEAFQRLDGSYWQYFQRAVMRWSPQAREVELLPLGALFYQLDKARAQAPPFAASGPGCTVYKPNTPPVCFAFRTAYERFGGPDILGDPISPLLVVDGWLVQYFTLGRMEYHPEAPPEHQVWFSPLGEWWFYHQQEDPALLLPSPNAIVQKAPLRLRVRAFVAQPVLLPEHDQHIFVTVTNGLGQGAPQATISLTLAPPETGSEAHGWVQTGVTDAQGVATFRVGWAQLTSLVGSGTWIRVHVHAKMGGLQPVVGSTYVDFRLWPSATR